MRWLRLWLAVSGIVVACSASKGERDNRLPSGASGRGGGAGQSGGSSGGPMISPEGGVPIDDAGTIAMIVPAGPVITVTGQPATVDFHVELADGTRVPCDTWAVDDTRIGSIGSDGIFHADGHVGGVVNVSATVSLTEPVSYTHLTLPTILRV